MISYSPRAARALALLKQPYNDVDIFVEDTGNHNMWLLIVRRLLKPGTKIVSVNMLGGRAAVIAACKLDQQNTGRKKLYIVDGDLDFLLGRRKPNLRYLYRLRAYSIENLLIREYPLITVGLETRPTLNENQIQAAIDYANLFSSFDQMLRGLFIAYAVAFSIDNSIKTVGHPVQDLLNNLPAGPALDVAKVRSRTIAIYMAATRASNAAVVRAQRTLVSARCSTMPIDQVASGKDYVLPLVLLPFKRRCGYAHGSEQFKVALAREYDPVADPYFSRRMWNIAA